MNSGRHNSCGSAEPVPDRRKLALHGANQPDQIGQNISPGWVRAPNDVREFTAETVPEGTIVEILA